MDRARPTQWLEFPRASWLALAAALLVALPTLSMGFTMDDLLHQLVFEGRWPLGTPLDLFRFAGGDAEGMRRIVQEGPYPWWTLPDLKIAFWRPLASALEALDHHLFGRSAVGYHLHSVAWYLGLVAAFGALLRRFLPGVLGGLALLLFAVNDAHVLPAGWISNRNAVISTTAALLGLWMHLAWREARTPRALPLSLAAFAVGLAGGETALSVLAYVVAYEALGAPGRPSERLRSLAPVTGLVLVYLAVYKALGYGAYGSTMYLDPLREPGRYLMAALGRVPALAGGLVGVPVDLWGIAPGSRPTLVALGLGGTALMALLLRAAWPGLSAEERRHCRWLAAGTALALLPVVATMPMARVLLVPSLGGSVLLAAVLLHAWRSRRQGGRSRLVVAASGVLALVHLVLSPLAWPAMTMMLRQIGARGEQQADQARRELESERLASQRILILDARDLGASMYVPIYWAFRGQALPRAWWPLSLVQQSPVLTRTGPASIELELPGGHFLATDVEQVLRSPEHRLGPGARVTLQGMQVAVLAADAEGPTRLGFQFDAPLEDPSLVLLHTRDGELRRLTPPPVGTRLELAAARASP